MPAPVLATVKDKAKLRKETKLQAKLEKEALAAKNKEAKKQSNKSKPAAAKKVQLESQEPSDVDPVVQSDGQDGVDYKGKGPANPKNRKLVKKSKSDELVQPASREPSETDSVDVQVEHVDRESGVDYEGKGPANRNKTKKRDRSKDDDTELDSNISTAGSRPSRRLVKVTHEHAPYMMTQDVSKASLMNVLRQPEKKSVPARKKFVQGMVNR